MSTTRLFADPVHPQSARCGVWGGRAGRPSVALVQSGPVSSSSASAAVAPGVTIRYEGNAQVELSASGGARVLIDVYDPTALSAPPTADDILLTTHTHDDHLSPRLHDCFPGPQLFVKEGGIDTPDVTITWHRCGSHARRPARSEERHRLHLRRRHGRPAHRPLRRHRPDGPDRRAGEGGGPRGRRRHPVRQRVQPHRCEQQEGLPPDGAGQASADPADAHEPGRREVRRDAVAGAVLEAALGDGYGRRAPEKTSLLLLGDDGAFYADMVPAEKVDW